MYFESEGPDNSQRTAELALKTADKRSIRDLVVATSTGATAKLFWHRRDLNIVAVSHVYGYPTPGENELTDAVRDDLIEHGLRPLTAAHALSGVERSLSKKFAGVYPVEIIAATLRLFGQGTKVAVEVATMALDAGLIPHKKPIIAIGGTNTGVDTALILTPSYSATFFDFRVHEVICKPV